MEVEETGEKYENYLAEMAGRIGGERETKMWDVDDPATPKDIRERILFAIGLKKLVRMMRAGRKRSN